MPHTDKINGLNQHTIHDQYSTHHSGLLGYFCRIRCRKISYAVNTLTPRQNGRHFPNEICKWIFLNENVWTSIETSLKFVPRGPIHNIPALVKIMARRRTGDKPVSEPVVVSLLAHMYVTQPQWINPFLCWGRIYRGKQRQYFGNTKCWCSGSFRRGDDNAIAINYISWMCPVFHEEGYQKPVPSYLREFIRNCRGFLWFPKYLSAKY